MFNFINRSVKDTGAGDVEDGQYVNGERIGDANFYFDEEGNAVLIKDKSVGSGTDMKRTTVDRLHYGTTSDNAREKVFSNMHPRSMIIGNYLHYGTTSDDAGLGINMGDLGEPQ